MEQEESRLRLDTEDDVPGIYTHFIAAHPKTHIIYGSGKSPSSALKSARDTTDDVSELITLTCTYEAYKQIRNQNKQFKKEMLK